MKENINFKLNIKFDNPVTVFALTQKGWLPLPFLSSPFILVDRNIISNLNKKTTSSQHWLKFINSPVFTLNPMLSAMESKFKKIPTYEEFISQFHSDSQILAEKLPKSKLINYCEPHFHAAYKIIEDLRPKQKNETCFLIEVSSLIKERAKQHKIKDLESRIIDSAKSNLLSSHSLVVLAALSSLYEHKNGAKPSIGKRLLKPKKSYTKESAHNALSDIRCLELLIASNILFDDSFSFITQDKALASFWCALNPRAGQYGNHTFTCNVQLNQSLFPRLSTEEIESLQAKLNLEL